MRNSLLLLGLMLTIHYSAHSQAATDLENAAGQWKIDPEKSELKFAIENFYMGTVKGTFTKITGDIEIASDLSASTVSVLIPAGTVESGIDKRDEHLKSDEFFDVAKYPNVQFSGSSIAKQKDKKNPYVLKGMLTIKDTEKQIEVPFNHSVSSDASFIVLVGKTKLNRSDFKLDIWDGMGVGETATVTFKVIARK